MSDAQEIRRVPYPGTEGAPTGSPHDMSHMVNIATMIADLQAILEKFGNTCVYVRRGGLSWGGVALNRRSDDEKFGLFDLQAQHDRALLQRAEQVERLIADRNAERETRWKCDAEITRLQERVAEMEGENERLRGACKIALLHAPVIRLAPERRHTISVLEAALAKETPNG